MVAAKLVTVTVPFTLKWATDALVAATGGKVVPGEDVSWLIGAPVLATVLYGLSRIIMALLMQTREGMFAKSRCTRCESWRSIRSSTCTACRYAFIWSARRAG